MSSNNPSNDELISNFCGITGVDAARGQTILESAQWDLPLALQLFYEHTSESGQSSPNPPIAQKTNTEEKSIAPKAGQPSTKKQMKEKKIATLETLKTSSSGADSKDFEIQDIGGSESGQQVLSPKKKKKSSEELVSDMTSAKAQSAQVVDTKAQDSTTNQSTDSSSAPNPDKRNIVLKLWQNGFSLDSGPLREYNDPQNQEFLESIRNKQIPKELIEKAGHEVHLDIEDHQKKQFEHKPPFEPFSGEGHHLGTPSSVVVPAPTTLPMTDLKSAETEALRQLNLNESEPKTKVRIRLSDGTNFVLNLNHRHTIEDIRRYITTVWPIYTNRSFVLMTTFPNKEITNENLSIKDLNLLNALVIQKLK